MADRGFDVEGDLPEGVFLNIISPIYQWQGPELSFEDETETSRIAWLGYT